MRRRAWVGLAALLLGGCAQTTPPPPAATSFAAQRARFVEHPGRGYDCTTHTLVLATVSNCGDGGFRILSPATE